MNSHPNSCPYSNKLLSNWFSISHGSSELALMHLPNSHVLKVKKKKVPGFPFGLGALFEFSLSTLWKEVTVNGALFKWPLMPQASQSPLQFPYKKLSLLQVALPFWNATWLGMVSVSHGYPFSYLWIMDECSSLAPWREIPWADVLQTFYDGLCQGRSHLQNHMLFQCLWNVEH